jgi:DNA sulfur modification protein DndB
MSQSRLRPAFEPIQLAAIRGRFGRWIFYSALVPLDELAKRVRYADEVHTNRRLAEMIQRRLDDRRSKDVAEYIATVPDRFFGALVVAVYDGSPHWYELGLKNTGDANISVGDIAPAVRGSVGVLSLSGEERLFALDGQHRLAGIRHAVSSGTAPPDDEVAAIFVEHKPNASGLMRTRRLFTTLNKKARPVAKADIIALDEDDIGAICARRLVDEYKPLSGERVSTQPTDRLDGGEPKAITTIRTLYDTAWRIVRATSPATVKAHKLNRPPDAILNELYAQVTQFFDELGRRVRPIGQFYESEAPERVVARYRSRHVLFRPVGLSLFGEVVATTLRRSGRSIESVVADVASAPLSLDRAPFAWILWNPSRRTVIPKGRRLAKDLLAAMVSEPAVREVQRLQSEVDQAAGDHRFSVRELLG